MSFSSNSPFADLPERAVFGTPGLSDAVQTIKAALWAKNTGDTRTAARNGASQLLPLIEVLRAIEA